MRFAYADPPYYGYSKEFYADHPDHAVYDTIEGHMKLINKLVLEYPDGWALSMTSGNLHDILPLCPRIARIAAWVKPFCSFKKHVSPAYTWEPVIFYRTRKHNVNENTVRDYLACNITLKKGLTGAKPKEFCEWILQLLGFQEGDIIDELFPGTAPMTKLIEERLI